MYVIVSGEKAGGFLTYIEEENIGNSYAFLFMPNPMEAIYVSTSDVLSDLEYDNIILVKKLPPAVYEVCKANFIYYAKKAGIYAGR